MNGIICEKIRLPKKMNIHSHNHAQLLLPLHGSIYIETDADRHLIDEHYLGFLPPECIHAYKGDLGNEFLVLNIPEYMVRPNDMSRIQGGSKLQFDERWKAIRQLVMSELAHSRSSSTLNSLFYYFYHYIAEHTASGSLNYINEHYTEDISIKTLADLEHYNVNYYYEWFRKKTGTTPTEYIKKLRMEKAKELLQNTAYSVLQVAELVGYHFNSSFTRAFKEATGISPAEFRRESRVSAK